MTKNLIFGIFTGVILTVLAMQYFQSQEPGVTPDRRSQSDVSPLTSSLPTQLAQPFEDEQEAGQQPDVSEEVNAATQVKIQLIAKHGFEADQLVVQTTHIQGAYAQGSAGPVGGGPGWRCLVCGQAG